MPLVQGEKPWNAIPITSYPYEGSLLTVLGKLCKHFIKLLARLTPWRPEVHSSLHDDHILLIIFIL